MTPVHERGLWAAPFTEPAVSRGLEKVTTVDIERVQPARGLIIAIAIRRRVRGD